MAQFSNELLQKFVSPAITIKPEIDLADLKAEFDQAEFWFLNNFGNSAFRASFNGKMQLYSQGLIARAHIVFAGYDVARKETIEYAEKWHDGAPGIMRYLYAVNAWESVFLNLQIVYDLMRNAFETSIDGRENRTRIIANRIKHVAEDIKGGLLTKTGLPIWFVSDGIATRKATVTFKELEEQVRFIAKFAQALTDPKTAKEQIGVLFADNS